MKTLITLNFALDIPEDSLAELAHALDESVYENIARVLVEKEWQGTDIDEILDWYGVTISIKSPIAGTPR